MSEVPKRFPKDILFQIRKEERLEDSSLLSVYLDTTLPLQEWADEVSEKTEEYYTEFERQFGREWRAILLTPLHMYSSQQGLFSASSSEFDKTKHTELTTAQLVFMGYEIGTDPEMLDSFTIDLTKRISQFQTINKRVKEDTLSSFVQIALYSGANYKDLCLKRIPEEEYCEPIATDDERLKDFRGFINGLEF